MTNEIRELSINDLEAVSGGMDCNVAAVLATIYTSAGQACGALGDAEGKAYFYGRADGIEQGCKK